MIGSAASWRRLLKIWLPGLVLLLLNLGVLSTYRFLLAGQSQMRTSRVDRLTSELEQLQERRQELSEVIAKAEVNKMRLDEFYRGWLASEADRLTRVIAEVKSLARNSGVKTSGFRYPDEVIEQFGLVRRSIVFSAEGSYSGMRKLVHAFERSEQLLILKEIGLTELGNPGAGLRVNFSVSTLFLSEVDTRKATT